ncbi:hypothetical protein [Pedobacter sp. BMA]|uniref:hypothetical protein n=1 Tax=Pedobacter sp. BMA TaxID=1663685 RepID=UPI000649AD9D|nr:hypothetical protein [Pedobacter sp. BMA]KLT63857.1 hypothetical protein AB669_19160 [Pedobacter sp. BMA]
MEQNAKGFNADLIAGSNMVMLDYHFVDSGQIRVYQLVRFAPGEGWNVLSNGFLLGSIKKIDEQWTAVNGEELSVERVLNIGIFIDQQHFNRLPEKIRQKWEDFIEQVIMQTDSEYIIVTRAGINFTAFKRFFTEYIGNLVEDDWAVEFKVYNADFDDDFVVRVF